MTVYHGFGPKHVRAVERAAEILDAINDAIGLCPTDLVHVDDLEEIPRLIRNLLEPDDNTRWSRKAEA